MATDTYIQQRNESNRKARAFLQDLLTGGPQTYQVVLEQAVKQGISKAALMLGAKYTLHVESRKSDGYAGLVLARRRVVTSPPGIQLGIKALWDGER